MFVPFLIMLREGLEAALIVSLIASYLKRTQRGRWIGVMWIGVLLAAALCLGLGIFINETTGEFPQKEQELFEGIVAVIAVVILTWMVFWMRKVSRNVKIAEAFPEGRDSRGRRRLAAPCALPAPFNLYGEAH
jgi:high-affinity iron transporter